MFLMISDTEFDLHKVGYQSVNLIYIISCLFAELTKGNWNNMLALFLHRIQAKDVMLNIDVMHHLKNVPKVFVLALIVPPINS